MGDHAIAPSELDAVRSGLFGGERRLAVNGTRAFGVVVESENLTRE